MMVALPRAVPIPRPFMALGPTRLNLEGLRGVKKQGGRENRKLSARQERKGKKRQGGRRTWVRWRACRGR